MAKKREPTVCCVCVYKPPSEIHYSCTHTDIQYTIHPDAYIKQFMHSNCLELAT